MRQLSLSTINLAHISELSSSHNEPVWLKKYRQNSLSVYEQLPPEVSPLYNKYSDAKRMDPQQVSLALDSDRTLPDFLQKRIDELKNEITVIQVGTNIHTINLPEEVKSQGLIISSIDDALKNNSELIQKTLEATNANADKYTALNNAAFDSGIFISIPRNLILKNKRF